MFRQLWVYTVFLLAAVPANASEMPGQVHIPVSAWDARTSEERHQFVLSWERQCRAKGYEGTVSVWSEDGNTLLGRRQPFQPVEIIPRQSPTYAVAPAYPAARARSFSIGQATTADVWILAILLIVLVVLLVSIWVSLVRWLFRINTIVERLDQIVTELKTIPRSDAGTQR